MLGVVNKNAAGGIQQETMEQDDPAAFFVLVAVEFESSAYREISNMPETGRKNPLNI